MLPRIINTLVDEFIAAHIIFRCYLVDKLQLILRDPEGLAESLEMDDFSFSQKAKGFVF